MRVKDPHLRLPGSEMPKRRKKAKNPQDEDSSDDVPGLTCYHVSQAVDVNQVKKTVSQAMWSVCQECLKERRSFDGDSVTPDVWLCLKCGYQGCSQNSEGQHSMKHFQAARTEHHCIMVNISTWTVWCYECDEVLLTHCNKKALSQILDFLQKYAARAGAAAASKVIKVREECADGCDLHKGKHSFGNVSSVPVKGLSNLGNTCFFNAVMQNLAQTHILNELVHEIKEKEPKLKISAPIETNLDPLVVTLPRPGPLTSAMFLLLHSMKETGKGPVSPKILFTQLCQKAPKFKGFQQQDSQELLHYLLDAIRVEETKRIQTGILKSFNNPTTKNADEETRRKVKAYGKEGVKTNFVDRIFVGEITSTVMCEECGHNRLTHERRDLRKLSSGDEEWNNAVVPTPEQSEDRNDSAVLHMSDFSSATQSAVNPSHSEGSEKDAGQSESSNDADSEASECESSVKQAIVATEAVTSKINIVTSTHSASVSETKHSILNGSSVDLSSAMSRLSLDISNNPDSAIVEQKLCFKNNTHDNVIEKPVVTQNPQTAFQTLSHSYTTSSKECSVQSCLYQFTSLELLMGNNKLLCEHCTERRQKHQRKTNSLERKTEYVYTNARKQLLISSVPPVLVLHLKRFHQAGLSLRKVNKHVDFPLILDLAPFCSLSCKNVTEGGSVLYSLYGVVEHSGSMKGGHYTAYIKVRTPGRKAENSANKNVQGVKESAVASAGQWVYVSDTHVQFVPESRILGSQAYLLFYERIF
ncbi:ubiquitin carboxyl-terminal hydrolase 45 isoform X2 [Protopterus annectens]|uniref:ubiquitin carboxyl-terminal hydrolase 45 isoform X2 n=1 Tax=Protopterus annectens TaxID=7888 RepID=UPI001CFA8A7C|nr:ubiquitin carboxyl-terminal hydrolase 45 isoform X2 [Protopterus annectens]